jgi:4'-phosphopantetheinyl transferase
MVTVYYAWIPDNLTGAFEERWLQRLPAERRDGLRRMRCPKVRTASLLGLALLQTGMQSSGFADFDLARVRFPRGGKPHSDPAVDFNISHSKRLVVCALSTESRVGIDTEMLREIRIESFERFLSARERAWVGDDRRRFFELWTQKEAVAKAFGKGGIGNLRRVTAADGKGTLDAEIWTLQELRIHQDYVTHVATDRPGTAEIRLRHLGIAA